MKSISLPLVVGCFLLFLSFRLPLGSQAPGPQPFVRPLDCPGGDCPLLRGAPQTTGMRSGFVRLKPGAAVTTNFPCFTPFVVIRRSATF